jgi:hypothetical protein
VRLHRNMGQSYTLLIAAVAASLSSPVTSFCNQAQLQRERAGPRSAASLRVASAPRLRSLPGVALLMSDDFDPERDALKFEDSLSNTGGIGAMLGAAVITALVGGLSYIEIELPVVQKYQASPVGQTVKRAAKTVVNGADRAWSNKIDWVEAHDGWEWGWD